MNILKTVSSVALALAASTASADLIYWQIQAATGNQHAGANANKLIPFAYATISAGDSQSYTQLHMYDDDGAQTGSSLLVPLATDPTSTEAIYSGTFDDSVTSFLVELWDNGGTRVGWQSYSASALADNIWKDGEPSASGGTPLTVTGVVPEPTSGLLLLLGMAGLALRRKRRA